jgi:hypothetical protein
MGRILSGAALGSKTRIAPSRLSISARSYRNPDGDTLTETWVINTIQDNTPQPKFFGTGTTTAISGDAAFLAAFGPVGTTDSFDWIEMPLSCAPAANCSTLDQTKVSLFALAAKRPLICGPAVKDWTA